MSCRPIPLLLLAAISAPLAPALAAQSAHYVVEELEPLGSFGSTRARDVNDAGQAVGHSNTDTLALRAVLWDPGSDATDLDGATPFSEALGISEGGAVAGHMPNAQGSSEAVRWVGGVPTFLGALPGAVGSQAFGTNDRGDACGVSLGALRDTAVRFVDGVVRPLTAVSGDSIALAMNSAGVIVGRQVDGVVQQAFRWEDGVLTVLPDLGGDVASAASISDAGWIAGAAVDGGDDRLHAVVWTPEGQVVDLGLLDGTIPTEARDVDDQGVAVGSAAIDLVGDETRAVLFADGEIVELDERLPPGSPWVLEQAHGINARGEIVGTGRLAGFGGERAFRLQPDCDGDGLADVDEIEAGDALDANGNAVPDACETCATDLGFGDPSGPTLALCGDDLTTAGALASLAVDGAPPSAPLFLFAGFVADPTPVAGGVLVPLPFELMAVVATDRDGRFDLVVPGGDDAVFDVVLQAVAPTGSAPLFSNAIQTPVGS